MRRLRSPVHLACGLALAALATGVCPTARAQAPGEARGATREPEVGSRELAILGAAEPRQHAGRGLAVALSGAGDRAVVSGRDGARFYVRVAEAWRLEHVVRDAPPRSTAVALSGDGSRALVGGALERSRWRVLVVARAGSDWRDEAVLEGEDRSEIAVALSADGAHLLIGLPRAGPAHAGRVEAYARSATGQWEREASVEGPRGGSFGASVALSADGSMALVGAPLDPGAAVAAGSAYLLSRSAGSWSVAAELRASDPAVGDRFGTRVALSADGRRALVAAPGDDEGGMSAVGSVRLFDVSWPTAGWAERGIFSAPAARGASPREGSAIALSADGTRALVATGSPRTGVWVYTTERERWSRAGTLVNGTGGAHRFGASLALSSDGRVALVGAPDDEIGGYGYSGSARLFALSANDGSGLPPPPPTLDERSRAAIAAARSDRAIHLRLERGLVQTAVLLPILAAGSWLAFDLVTRVEAYPPPEHPISVGFGLLLEGCGVAGIAVVAALAATGIGQAMGGRGHLGGTMAGLAVGLLLGVGVVAGAHELASASPPGSRAHIASLATGTSLAALLAGVGAMVGYVLRDAHEQAQADAIELLPIASIGPDGASIGAHGTF